MNYPRPTPSDGVFSQDYYKDETILNRLGEKKNVRGKVIESGKVYELIFTSCDCPFRYWEETIVRDLAGEVIETIPGDVMLMPNGEIWNLADTSIVQEYKIVDNRKKVREK